MADSIYEKRPNGPNFLLIVILSCIVILIIFAVSLFILKYGGKEMSPHGPNPTPNSRLSIPAFVPQAAGSLVA